MELANESRRSVVTCVAVAHDQSTSAQQKRLIKAIPRSQQHGQPSML